MKPCRSLPKIQFHSLHRLDSREDLFSALYRLFFEEGGGFSQEEMEEAINQREAMGDTYIGRGIVLLHLPSDKISSPSCAFLRLDKPFLWQSLHSGLTHPTTTFITLAFPRRQKEVDPDCFSGVFSAVLSDGFEEEWKKVESEEELVQWIRRWGDEGELSNTGRQK